MKFIAICENHLYSKAYSKGKRAVTSALAVYVLPDYKAKALANGTVTVTVTYNGTEYSEDIEIEVDMPEDADALFEELKTTVPSAQRIGTVAEYQGGARIKLR